MSHAVPDVKQKKRGHWKGQRKMRKYYLDNMKWFIILLVPVFHVVSVFGSKGMMSVNEPGIAALDSIGYMLYPWFMCCLFVAAGVSAKHALETRDRKAFLKERVSKLLLPLVSYTVLVGPFAAELSFKANRLDKTLAALPAPVIVLIKIVSGMGPSWFLLQLLLISLVLVLILKLDKKQKLTEWGAKCSLPVLLLFYFPVLLAAQLLYVTYTYRNMLYLLLFLMGYAVFSHDSVIKTLAKYAPALLAAGLALGAVQTCRCWGKVYQTVVNDWVVMLYTWVMMLAVFGCFARFFDRQNRFTARMTGLSFGIYLFHYVPLIYIAYFLSAKCRFPYAVNYLLTLAGTLACAVLLTVVVTRIPGLNVLFGLKRQGNNHSVDSTHSTTPVSGTIGE